MITMQNIYCSLFKKTKTKNKSKKTETPKISIPDGFNSNSYKIKKKLDLNDIT